MCIDLFFLLIIGEPFPLFLQEILEWELSSITPIVVRNIVQNSGFKLVTNDHNLTQNNPNNSINQSNQNMDSLSNDTGITPSIVKRIDGGTASLPGVSMVLAKSRELFCCMSVFFFFNFCIIQH